MPKYDYLIVGAGLFGSVFARRMTDAGCKCLVIDKREHIGGNCFTQTLGGIDVHRYGPHIFHTSSRRIWDYVRRFAEFHPYRHKVKACCGNRIFSFPINLLTLHQLWGVGTPEEAAAELRRRRVAISAPANFEEWALSQVGRELYELFFRGYTQKQWGKEPRELPASIFKRLPIRLSFDDDYFADPYQGIPLGGYTAIFEKLLDGIEVRLGMDYFAQRKELDQQSHRIVYTGMIDRFFDYSLGRLEWRSLRFQTQDLPMEDYQGGASVNYCDAEVPFTRITEFKHFLPPTDAGKGHSVITHEFPQPWTPQAEPYYPINTKANDALLAAYRSLKPANVIFGGRLGDYRYYDMDQVIGSAIARAEAELETRGPAQGRSAETPPGRWRTSPPQPAIAAMGDSNHPESVIIPRATTAKAEPMKLIYACSPSHRILRDEVLLPSLQRVGEQWELIEITCPHVGNGDFKSSDYNANVQARVEGLRRIVSESAGQVVVFSDVDVQFFRPVQALALQRLGDRDAVFQMEDAAATAANFGFAVLRCGPAVRALLDLLCEAAAMGQWDQGRLNELIARNAMPCRFGFLPPAFANDSNIPPGECPPAGMVLYHSILTFPKPGSSSVAQKLQLHRAMAARLNDQFGIAGIGAGLCEAPPSPPENACFTLSTPQGRRLAGNVILQAEGRVYSDSRELGTRSWHRLNSRPDAILCGGIVWRRRGQDLVTDNFQSLSGRRLRPQLLRQGRLPNRPGSAWRGTAHLTPQRPLPGRKKFEVVVAKYREDTRWTDAIPANRTIYCKDTSCGEHCPYFLLPNIGREYGTYLHHIVTHYDTLAERTLFVQGDPFFHRLPPLDEFAFSGEDFQSFVNMHHTLEQAVNWGWPDQTVDGNVKRAFLELLEIEADFDSFSFTWGAQFAVSRQAILRRPLDYYRRLCDIANSPEMSLAGRRFDNLHLGFMFEFFWDRIFGEDTAERAMAKADGDGGAASLAPVAVE